jgi:ABC-type multidrug transport system ATPase subunit
METFGRWGEEALQAARESGKPILLSVGYSAFLNVQGPEEQEDATIGHNAEVRKKVTIAVELVMDPGVLFMDEPTTGLDPIAGARIDSLIRRVWEQLLVTSVAVTHDMPSARRISDRILMLQDGVIYADGRTNEILTSTDPIIYNFVNGIPTSRPATTASAAPLSSDF